MKPSGRKARAAPGKRPRNTTAARGTTGGRRSAAKTQSAAPLSDSPGIHWTFLTNHAHVLVLLSRNPSLVLREVALGVGITERAVQRIISDLEASGIIEREKIGRQNHYRIRLDQPLRHHNESHRSIGDLLELINGA